MLEEALDLLSDRILNEGMNLLTWYILMIKANEMQLFLNFIFLKNSACFGQVHCPSSGVSQQCIHSNWYLSC